MKNIKDRNLEERMAHLKNKKELEETFSLVAANNEMTKEILDELIPLADQVRKMRQNTNKKSYGPLTQAFLQKYMDGDVDKIFGIRYANHVPWIGNQDITILNNDKIVV